MLRLPGTRTDPTRRDGLSRAWRRNAGAAFLVAGDPRQRTSRCSLDATPLPSSLSSSTFPNVSRLPTRLYFCHICIASSMLSHLGITNDHGGLMCSRARREAWDGGDHHDLAGS